MLSFRLGVGLAKVDARNGHVLTAAATDMERTDQPCGTHFVCFPADWELGWLKLMPATAMH
ncbi:hypothetical protein [Calycomorphotria hydatis]|uniref:hypothetical protein n=1 Tax=Calycomorphotria hydatis TaxID=2528027 RepID=UPI00119D6D80|nr:hypothetical protein [Calycomorphotria hydatis]